MNFFKKIIFSTKSDIENNNNLLANELLELKETLKNINSKINLIEIYNKKLLERIDSIENKIDIDNEKVEKIADAVNIYLFKDLIEKYNMELNQIIQQNEQLEENMVKTI